MLPAEGEDESAIDAVGKERKKWSLSSPRLFAPILLAAAKPAPGGKMIQTFFLFLCQVERGSVKRLSQTAFSSEVMQTV